MKESAIQTEIAVLQLKLHRAKQDYESALINQVDFDKLKILRQMIHELESTIDILQKELSEKTVD